MRSTVTATTKAARDVVVPQSLTGEKVVLGVLVLIAMAVRLPPWGASLWIDEGTTYSMVSRPWEAMIRLFAEEPNGLLYALLAHPFVNLGDSEWVLRLPSMIAAVLAVVALWWTARELELQRAALAAAALLALNPLAVKFSADARPYSIVVLVSCLSMAAVARAVRVGRARWWVAYAVCLVALAYLNALALLVVPVHALVILRSRRSPWTAWLRSLVAAGLAVLPLAVLLARDRAERNPLYWLSADSFVDLAREGAKFLGYHPVVAAAELALIGAAAVASRRWFARPASGRLLHHPITPVVGWAVLPPLAVFGLSQISPLLKDRYFVAALPGVCLLVAACLLPWRRSLATILLTMLLLGSAVVIVERNWRFQRMGEDWRGAVRQLEAMRAPEDVVIFEQAEGLTVAGYYSDSFRLPDGRTVVTEWDHQLPSGVLAYQHPGGYSEVPVGPVSAATLAEHVRASGRVFVVVMDYGFLGAGAFDGPGALWARTHCSVDHRVFTRVVLAVITNCRNPGR